MDDIICIVFLLCHIWLITGRNKIIIAQNSTIVTLHKAWQTLEQISSKDWQDTGRPLFNMALVGSCHCSPMDVQNVLLDLPDFDAVHFG